MKKHAKTMVKMITRVALLGMAMVVPMHVGAGSSWSRATRGSSLSDNEALALEQDVNALLSEKAMRPVGMLISKYVDQGTLPEVAECEAIKEVKGLLLLPQKDKEFLFSKSPLFEDIFTASKTLSTNGATLFVQQLRNALAEEVVKSDEDEFDLAWATDLHQKVEAAVLASACQDLANRADAKKLTVDNLEQIAYMPLREKLLTWKDEKGDSFLHHVCKGNLVDLFDYCTMPGGNKFDADKVMDLHAQNNSKVAAICYAGSNELAERVVEKDIVPFLQKLDEVSSRLALEEKGGPPDERKNLTNVFIRGFFQKVCSAGSVSLFDKILPLINLSPYEAVGFAVGAASSGSIAGLKWVDKNLISLATGECFVRPLGGDLQTVVAMMAAQSGSLECLQWVNDNVKEISSLPDESVTSVIIAGSMSGEAKVQKWMKDNVENNISSLPTEQRECLVLIAALLGSVDYFQWLNDDVISFASLSDDIKKGLAAVVTMHDGCLKNVDCLNCLNGVQGDLLSLPSRALDMCRQYALQSGDIKCFQWLMENDEKFSCQDKEWVASIATAVSKSVGQDYFEWVNDNIYPFSSMSDEHKKFVVMSVAVQGSVSCLNWVLDQVGWNADESR